MENFDNETSFQAAPSADLRKYFWLLWRWAWLIALTAILAAVGAYIFSRMQTPIYQANTTILVNESASAQASNYSAIYLTSERLTSTYAAMLTKKPMMDKVIERLGIKDSTLTFGVKVNAVRDTQLLQLLVESTDPYMAANVANELVAVFTDEIRKLQESKYLASKENLQSQLTYLEKQIEDNSQALETVIQNNINLLQQQPAPEVLTEPTQSLEERARQLNQPEIDQLETRLTQYRQIYASVLASYEQVRLAEAQTTTSFIQVEMAVPPTDAIRPQVLRNTLLAAIVGLMLAVGVIFAIEFLDDTIHDPETITSITGLPVLATISRHEQTNNEPITQSHPRSPVSESFRSLRTNVKYASVDKPVRRLIITSPTPEDGKTTIITNLAIALAQGSSQVVLIDADLRRPRVHKVFGLENKVGLSSLFVQPEIYLDNNLQNVKTENLQILSSGGTPPNPSELLGSRKMNDILKQLEEKFDIILLDTPPVLTVTDAVALSSSVDGVMLVAKIGKTKQAALLQAIEQLRQVNANIVGIVINDVDTRSARYYYYYRNYYYDHYSSYYSDSADGSTTKKKRSGSSRDNGKVQSPAAAVREVRK
jgi:succinoglycan biosynthesis transport protein ExoP